MSLWDIEENVTKLKELFANGGTGASIAAALGITRNTAIGKLHRLGLTRPRPHKERQIRPDRPLSRVAYAKPTKELVDKSLLAIIDREGISILELTFNSCRAIINKKCDRYCGLETADGQSFCPGHRQLYYRPCSPSYLPNIG